MIARLELQGGLAPVQDYGRHLTNMAPAKKKKAPEGVLEDSAATPLNDKNDQFYDLDDNFIDDGDVGAGPQDELGTEFLQSEKPETSETQQNFERREQEEEEKIKAKFKVLSP